MLLMESYFDDSSDARHQEYYACGCAVAGQDQWDCFDFMWLSETHRLQEPFRATECECGHGQFKDWPKPERDDLMGRLVNLIRQFKIFGIASIVPIETFKRVFPDLETKEAFFLTVTQGIMNMAQIARRASFEIGVHGVDLWFEQGPHNGAIHSTFDSIRGMKNWAPSRSLRGIHFDSKEIRPLQSADLIAREAFKHMQNRGIRPTRIPVRLMSDTLCFMLWTEESLRFLAKNGGPRNYEFLSSFDETEGASRLQHFWRRSWAYHEQKDQSIRPFPPNNERLVEGIQQGDQSEAERGKGSEKAEES